MAKFKNDAVPFILLIVVLFAGAVILDTYDASVTGEFKNPFKKRPKPRPPIPPPAQVQPPAQVSQCVDNDAGKTYEIKGLTKGVQAWVDVPVGTNPANLLKQEEDYCTTICEGNVGAGKNTQGPCLLEFYCAKHPNKDTPPFYAAFDVKKCEYGCTNGACNQPPAQQPQS